MALYYAASSGGFYNSEIHGVMPADAVGITDSDHADLLAAQAAGKLIAADADGRPVAVDRPGPSPEQLAAKRRADILAALAVIDAASARPLRAIVTGAAAQADHDRLTDLESQAATLRAELATIPAPEVTA